MNVKFLAEGNNCLLLTGIEPMPSAILSITSLMRETTQPRCPSKILPSHDVKIKPHLIESNLIAVK
jgi:hypothetical protein